MVLDPVLVFTRAVFVDHTSALPPSFVLKVDNFLSISHKALKHKFFNG